VAEEQEDACDISSVPDLIIVCRCSIKARLHQRRSNLGSTELRSPVNGDLNRVRVTFCCTNLNLVQLTVDQLIGDLNPGYNVDNADWLQTVTSHAIAQNNFATPRSLFLLFFLYFVAFPVFKCLVAYVRSVISPLSSSTENVFNSYSIFQ